MLFVADRGLLHVVDRGVKRQSLPESEQVQDRGVRSLADRGVLGRKEFARILDGFLHEKES